MRFQRIDEETVCCLLTEEDMKEYGLETKDFLTDKEKVHKFLEIIVEQAKEEVGYEAKSGMLAMQIAVLPDNGLAITFSEKAEDGIKNVLDQIMNNTKVLGDINQPEGVKSEQEKYIKNAESYIYCFDKFKTLETFCNKIKFDKPMKSRLYKDRKENKYYLLLRKGKLSKKEFEVLQQLASEFGIFVSSQNVKAAYMEEHYQCMIRKKAVNVIQSL